MAADLTRMLDVDEHGFAIRRKGQAGDLATRWTDQETSDLFGRGIGSQHLIVALASVVADVAEVAIRLNPQPTKRIEAETIGTVEHVGGGNVAGACVYVAGRGVRLRIARDQEEIPNEGRCAGIAAGLIPFYDVAPVVDRSRIGFVYWRTGSTANGSTVGRIAGWFG